MHACDLTQTFISGYAAQAGQNNGQANKGNGIIYIHTCSIYTYNILRYMFVI